MRFLTEGSGEKIGDDLLVFIVPLTPSLNELFRWKATGPTYLRGVKYTRHRRHMGFAIAACARQALGVDYPRPWANKVLIKAIRCSAQRRRIDETNLRGGLKPVEDALVEEGIIPDDSPMYVRWGDCEDRVQSMWGELAGPATYLYISSVAPSKRT